MCLYVYSCRDINFVIPSAHKLLVQQHQSSHTFELDCNCHEMLYTAWSVIGLRRLLPGSSAGEVHLREECVKGRDGNMLTDAQAD